jgi:hypothetical protein
MISWDGKEWDWKNVGPWEVFRVEGDATVAIAPVGKLGYLRFRSFTILAGI